MNLVNEYKEQQIEFVSELFANTIDINKNKRLNKNKPKSIFELLDIEDLR